MHSNKNLTIIIFGTVMKFIMKFYYYETRIFENFVQKYIFLKNFMSVCTFRTKLFYCDSWWLKESEASNHVFIFKYCSFMKPMMIRSRTEKLIFALSMQEHEISLNLDKKFINLQTSKIYQLKNSQWTI